MSKKYIEVEKDELTGNYNVRPDVIPDVSPFLGSAWVFGTPENYMPVIFLDDNDNSIEVQDVETFDFTPVKKIIDMRNYDPGTYYIRGIYFDDITYSNRYLHLYKNSEEVTTVELMTTYTTRWSVFPELLHLEEAN